MPYSFIKLYNTGELLYLLCDRGAHLKQMFASKKRSHLFASQQTTLAAETRVLCKLPTDLCYSYDKWHSAGISRIVQKDFSLIRCLRFCRNLI